MNRIFENNIGAFHTGLVSKFYDEGLWKWWNDLDNMRVTVYHFIQNHLENP